MNSEKDGSTHSTGSTGLALVEKISDIPWVMQLAQIVFFVDLALLWKTGHGISESSITVDQLLRHSGLLVAGLLILGVMVSVVLPIFGEVARFLVGLLPIPKWLQTDRDYRRPNGCVFPHELLDLALKGNSSFLLDLYQEHEEKKEAERLAQFKSGRLIFSALILALLDFEVAQHGMGASFLGEIYSVLGNYGGITLLMLVLWAIFGLKWAWFSGFDSGWIYYPPLCDEIEKEQRMRQGFDCGVPLPSGGQAKKMEESVEF